MWCAASSMIFHIQRISIVTRVWIESVTQFRTGVLVEKQLVFHNCAILLTVLLKQMTVLLEYLNCYICIWCSNPPSFLVL